MPFLEIVDNMICSLFIKSNYLSYCDLEGEMYGPRLPEYKKYSPEKLKLLQNVQEKHICKNRELPKLKL